MLNLPYVLYKADIGTDAAGQQVISYTADKVIDAYIAYANKTDLPQNPAFENCTYVGFTLEPATTFQKQDKLGDYIITDFVSNNRFTFLLLEK